MRTNSTNNHFDVIIIGGGPAGTAAAMSLSQMGYKTALVDRSSYNKIRFGETVPPGIKKLLNQLGVWAKFVEDKHFPASGIQSTWGENELYEKNYIFSPYGSGWHLDRLKFDTMMVNAAENKDVWVLQGGRVEECIDDANGKWIMNCTKQDQVYRLHSRLVIDASGRASFIARKKNIRRISYDKLIGIAFIFPAIAKSISKSFALIEAAENGWWYSAELPDLRTIIAYMTDSDLYPHSLGFSAFFTQTLSKTRYTKERATAETAGISPHTLSASSSRLKSFGALNWLAIGDAAMSFDPLSAQGICGALESGLTAAQEIHKKFTFKKYNPEMFFSKMEDDWEKYLSSRAFYYQKENRWPKSLFWQRRQVDNNAPIDNKSILKREETLTNYTYK